MRGLVGALLVCGCVLSAVVAQDAKEPPKKLEPRQAQFKELIEEYFKVQNEAQKAESAAKTPAEKKAAAAKKPSATDYMPRLYKLLDADAKDDIALNCLAFAFYELQTKDEKANKLLWDNFGKSKKMEMFVGMAIEGDPESLKPLLEKVFEEHPEKSVKAIAALGLANMAAKKESESKQAEGLFEKIIKDFPDVEIDNVKIAEMAKLSLEDHRTLGIGKPAPVAESETLKGEKTSLAVHKGKVVVLDIWATWCGPCRAMIPHEREMVERLKDKPFTLISVSADDDKETLEKFLEKEKMPWVHWFAGPKGAVLKTYNVRFFPTIYVIDAKGVIRAKNLRGEELEQMVDKLIAEVKK